MTRKFLIALGLVIAVITVTIGCGDTSTHSFSGPQKKTTQGTVPSQYRPCSPTNYYMQCALRDQKPSHKLNLFSSSSAGRGVDFAWGAPSCGTFHANGWDVAATYFDTHDMSKGWTRGLVNYFSACGVSHLAVWESTSGRATNGYWAGVQDAKDALWVAGQVGMQSGRPIFFAVDCDCSGSSVASYFDGVKSVLGVNRTGAYAGYWPTKYLFDTGRIRYGWQTYAWSGGNWDPRAHFRQYLNDNSVDFDSHTAGDYGQWPYNAAPSGPTPKQIGQHNGRKKQARHNWDAKRPGGCGRHTTWGDCARFRNTVVAEQDWLERVAKYKHVHCWGPHARRGEAVCVVLRPTYATDLRLAAASRQAYWSHNCQKHPRRSDCKADAATTAYRNAQAKKYWRKYGP